MRQAAAVTARWVKPATPSSLKKVWLRVGDWVICLSRHGYRIFITEVQKFGRECLRDCTAVEIFSVRFVTGRLCFSDTKTISFDLLVCMLDDRVAQMGCAMATIRSRILFLIDLSGETVGATR